MNREQNPPVDDAQRRRLLAALGAAGICTLAPWQRVLAQKGAWPDRPISYVVPFPPAVSPTWRRARSARRSMTPSNGTS